MAIDHTTLIGAVLTGGVGLWILQSLAQWAKVVLKRRKARKAIFNHLCGLPYELKAVMMQFYMEGAHTLPGDPSDFRVEQLLRQGLLTLGSASGGYAAVNSYLSVRPNVWEVVRDEWGRKDPETLILMAEWAAREQAADEGSEEGAHGGLRPQRRPFVGRD